MAKLHYRFGPVSSGKSLALLSVAANYETHGRTVALLKPRVDSHGYGITVIGSRAGLEREADLVTEARELSSAELAILRKVSCVLVDEAQFLHPPIVDQLRQLSALDDVPVICFGLRTDFRRRAFEASIRLFELADCFEELRTVCWRCERLAVHSLRIENGSATTEGGREAIGDVDLACFRPACAACYHAETTSTPTR